MQPNGDLGLISQEKDIDLDQTAYEAWLRDHEVPRPSREQADWLDMRVGMFVHFGINTYHDMEWSDGTLDPATFNPTHMDCHQWVRVAKSMGAKYMVLTAKHHDGFCLWPTTTTDYSVKSSPWKHGKGDVVAEFVAACNAAGMNCGLYLSPWDRHEPCYPDKAAYDKFYETQLTELLTWYAAKYVELWFDGAGSAGREYDWERIIATCKHHQPAALVFNMGEPAIRWAGNERGLAPYPLWNVVSKEKYPGIKKDKPEYFWLPAECDMPIRYQTWFYNTQNDFSVAPLEELMKVYTWSVGRGANLLLNLAPDRRGLIPELDASMAKQMGDAITRLFSSPVAVVEERSGAEFMIKVADEPQNINYLVLQEDIRAGGQRVKAYRVEVDPGEGKWLLVVEGSSIGHEKIDVFPPVKATRIKVTIMESWAEPLMSTISAFYSPDYEAYRQYMED